MKIITILFLFSLTIHLTVNAQTIKTEDDSLAYSLGVLIADNLRQEGFGSLNSDLISLGLKSALKGEAMLMTTEECGVVVREGSARLKMKQHESNRTAGEEFLATNKMREGVTVLDNGLQYEILQTGNGAKPKATDKVLVHYHGTLINGQIFDSSVKRGEPITFGLNQVIKGWTEILQLMPVGSKWKVYIPYHLAYGERAAGAEIKPYSTLIFEIELLAIE
jgi:FKBP-type peptidyl-prolyl cis-trans isomerase FklB